VSASIQDDPVLNPWATADDALAEVLAGLRRARMGALFAAAWGNAARFNVFQTMARTLADLLNGSYQYAAVKDASRPYEPPSGFEAAWAALPVSPEVLSMADMQQFLRGQGVDVAGDEVTELDVDACKQLKDDEFAAFRAQQEHAGAAVDGHHRADEIAFHGGAL
jgi:hypothetical protein